MKTLLKQMIINKEKNWQIEINEKPPDLVKIEEENWSTGEAGYYVFAFLFRVLVVAGLLQFYLVALIGLLLGQSIVSRAIKGTVSIGGEFAINLLRLFLWKVPISFWRYCTANASF